MKQKLITFIESFQLTGKKLLIAVSAGIDSMVLLHLLVDLKSQFELQIAVCHVDHMLRPESKTEQEFVSEICQVQEIDFYPCEVDVRSYQKKNKLSIEMAAHECRYHQLIQIADKIEANYIVTAHHFDDQIETIFQRLGFGTGIEGIQGLAGRNNRFLKPLLELSKTEIEKYAQLNKINFFVDSSNQDNTISRNFWRNEILPKIRTRFGTHYFDKMIESIKNVNWSNRDYQLMDSFTASTKKQKNQVLIEKSSLIQLPDAFLKALIERVITHHFGQIIQLNKSQFKQFLSVLNSKESGKQVIINKLFIETAFDKIAIFYDELISNTEFKLDADQKIQLTDFVVSLSIVKEAKFTSDKTIEYADASNMVFPLTLRKKKAGDHFFPIGLDGKQSINRHLKSKNVNQALRNDFWVLCDRDSIIWLLGERLDQRYSVKTNSKKIIKLEMIKHN